MEATAGFEPANNSFAESRVRPLRHVAREDRAGPGPEDGCPSRIRTSVHGSKVRCPTARRRGSGTFGQDRWSGRRDSNPRPSPWQGDALPLSHFRSRCSTTDEGGAESQDRTGDTAIFSRVLYRLSYLGPMANQAFGCPSAVRRIPRAFASVPPPARAPHATSGPREESLRDSETVRQTLAPAVLTVLRPQLHLGMPDR